MTLGGKAKRTGSGRRVRGWATKSRTACGTCSQRAPEKLWSGSPALRGAAKTEAAAKVVNAGRSATVLRSATAGKRARSADAPSSVAMAAVTVKAERHSARKQGPGGDAAKQVRHPAELSFPP